MMAIATYRISFLLFFYTDLMPFMPIAMAMVFIIIYDSSIVCVSFVSSRVISCVAFSPLDRRLLLHYMSRFSSFVHFVFPRIMCIYQIDES